MESRLQRRCLDWARDEHRGRVLAVNIHGGGWSNKGFPDLLVFANGRAAAVELKSGTGYKVQPDQQVWAARFEKCGVEHHVVRSLEEFSEIVERMMGC